MYHFYLVHETEYQEYIEEHKSQKDLIVAPINLKMNRIVYTELVIGSCQYFSTQNENRIYHLKSCSCIQ